MACDVGPHHHDPNERGRVRTLVRDVHPKERDDSARGGWRTDKRAWVARPCPLAGSSLPPASLEAVLRLSLAATLRELAEVTAQLKAKEA